MERAGFLPVLPVGVIGSRTAIVYEPRQVREEATVNGPLWVLRGRLITPIGRTGRKSAFRVFFSGIEFVARHEDMQTGVVVWPRNHSTASGARRPSPI